MFCVLLPYILKSKMLIELKMRMDNYIDQKNRHRYKDIQPGVWSKPADNC